MNRSRAQGMALSRNCATLVLCAVLSACGGSGSTPIEPTPTSTTTTTAPPPGSSLLQGIYRFTLTTSPSCAAYPSKTLSFGLVTFDVDAYNSFTAVNASLYTCNCGTFYGTLSKGTLTLGMDVLGTVSSSGVMSAPVTDRKIRISGPFTTTTITSPITGTADPIIFFEHGTPPNEVVDEGCYAGGHTFTLTRQ